MDPSILVVNSLDEGYGSTYRIRSLAKLFESHSKNLKYIETPGSAFKKLYQSVRATLFHPYDVLITQKFNPITVAAMVIARIRRKIVVTDWDDLDPGLQDTTLKRLIAQVLEAIGPYLCHAITSHNQEILRKAKRKCNLSSYIPQGYWNSSFNPHALPSQEDLRIKLGLPLNRILIGHICTYTSGGTLNLDTLMEKVSFLQRSDVHYIWIGTGEKLSRFQKLAKDLGIQKNSTFVGHVAHSEIPQWLKSFDATLVWMDDRESNRARVSFKVLESLAMNIPVLGQVVGITRDLFGKWILPLSSGTIDTLRAPQSAFQQAPMEPDVRNYAWENIQPIAHLFLAEVLSNSKVV